MGIEEMVLERVRKEAWAEGWSEGLAEGRAEGMAELKAEIQKEVAINLILKTNAPSAQIADCVQTPISFVEDIRKSLGK